MQRAFGVSLSRYCASNHAGAKAEMIELRRLATDGAGINVATRTNRQIEMAQRKLQRTLTAVGQADAECAAQLPTSPNIIIASYCAIGDCTGPDECSMDFLRMFACLAYGLNRLAAAHLLPDSTFSAKRWV
eukprot:6209522-Pleurochrysis_carterae.AAC.1